MVDVATVQKSREVSHFCPRVGPLMLIIEILIVFREDLIQLYKTETATALVKYVASVNASSSVPLPTSDAAHVFASLLGIAFDADDIESVN